MHVCDTLGHGSLCDRPVDWAVTPQRGVCAVLSSLCSVSCVGWVWEHWLGAGPGSLPRGQSDHGWEEGALETQKSAEV